MHTHRLLTIKLISTIGPALWCTVAVAQEEGGEPAGQTVEAPAGNTTIVVNPSATTTETTATPWGVPPEGYDPDEGLPSAAREAGTDGFDLQGPGSTATVRGGNNSSFVLSGSSVAVPPYHTVRRGDTLWGLSSRYYDNPYAWPRVWSYNPQIENPHWIYPGDRLRMRTGTGGSEPTSASGGGFISRQSMVPPGTVFLRDRGFIGDERKDVWGKLVGSPDDQMLLSDGDDVYLEISKDHEVRVGQELAVFNRLRKPEEGDAKGYIVAIHGTVRIKSWNEDTRVARAEIIESLDVIERGMSIAPLGRRFDVVPPVQNDREVWAKIVAAVEPRELIGQHQVVFIDKGSRDGLRAGNRLFAIRRGDRWNESVKVGREMTAHRMHYELRRAEVERAEAPARQAKLPTEVSGEIRVLRTKERTSLCVVTYSQYEFEPGQVVVARRGY